LVDPAGSRSVMGVVNVAGFSGGAVYSVTFSRGSSDTAGVARPNVGAWIEAALGGRFFEKSLASDVLPPDRLSPGALPAPRMN
jgi:hypothetical protein